MIQPSFSLATFCLLFIAYPLIEPSRASTDLFLIVFAVHSFIGLHALGYPIDSAKRPQLVFWLVFALPRLILLTMDPWLSDDVLRYLWDGSVLAEGFNPYLYAPAAPELAALQGSELYAILDYKDVHTIYPPLAQLCFAAASATAALFSDSWQAANLIWKLILIASEAVGLLFLLRSLKLFRLSRRAAGLYLLVPLPVVEIAGQSHIDGLIVGPLGALLYCSGLLYRHRQTPKSGISDGGADDKIAGPLQGIAAGWSGLLVGAAFLLKFLPGVLLLPIIRLGRRSAFIAAAACALAAFAGMLPFFWQTDALLNLIDTFNYYSNILQFNGVPLYTLNALMDVLEVDNYWLLAPRLLSLLKIAVVLAVALLYRIRTSRDLYAALLLSFFFALILAGKVHTWYFVPLLLINCLVGFRWLIFFALASMASYAIYLSSPPQEAYLIEYVVWLSTLGLALWEMRGRRNGAAELKGEPAGFEGPGRLPGDNKQL